MTSRRIPAKRAPKSAGSGSPAPSQARGVRNETPWFPIALLGLFAVGCMADWSWQKKRRSLSFQVAEDSPLYEPARRAAEKWSSLIGRPITVTADGVYLSDDPECWDGVELSTACSHITSDEGDGYIAVLTDTDPSDYYNAILHEMGHHIRGLLQPEHLDDPETLLFHAQSVPEPTPKDVQFVCENFDCNVPSAS